MPILWGHLVKTRQKQEPTERFVLSRMWDRIWGKHLGKKIA